MRCFRRSLKGLISALIALLLVLETGIGPALAKGRISFLRDAETEELLRDYTAPIYRAAGVGGAQINIYLVNNKQFNAFVADGRRIFINIGVLLDAATPNQVTGVIAHETGHMAGGHLARLHDQIASAQAISVLSMLLAAGAAVAGAGSASSAIALGGQQVAQRSILRYQRGEERTADRAGLKYLEATGQSGRGMVETFEKLADQDLFGPQFIDPYARSHPTPRDRIESIRAIASKSRYFDRKDPPALQFRHDMMRAKVTGYAEAPNTIMRRYPARDKSLPARYARAVMDMRRGQYRKALRGVNGMIAERANYAYLHELKGDILVQAGRPKEAITPYRQAMKLKPNEPLLRASYAKALVTANQPRLLNEAVAELRRALGREPDHVEGWLQLAIAYGRLGRAADADLASAEAALARGDLNTAQQLAGRAKNRFKPGSPGWIRADDISKFRPRNG